MTPSGQEDSRTLAQTYLARAAEELQNLPEKAPPLEMARIYTDIAQVCASLAVAEAVTNVEWRLETFAEYLTEHGIPVHGTIKTRDATRGDL